MKVKVFTIIELLIVVAIIGILASILLPSLQKARYTAQNLVCVNNLGQMSRVTFLFCKDNNNKYPNRGWKTEIGLNSPDTNAIFRWAGRSITLGPNRESLYDSLGKYISLESKSWVCPLYEGRGVSRTYNDEDCDGGHQGCLKHGAAHKTLEMTYSLHAGISQKNYGAIVFNEGRGRRTLGDPWTVTWNGDYNESRVLWSDSATADNSPFPIQRPGNILRTNHRPPPWVNWESAYKTTTSAGGIEWGVLNVYGTTYSNYSFDDGAAKAIRTSNKILTDSGQVKAIGDGSHAYLVPVED